MMYCTHSSLYIHTLSFPHSSSFFSLIVLFYTLSLLPSLLLPSLTPPAIPHPFSILSLLHPFSHHQTAVVTFDPPSGVTGPQETSSVCVTCSTGSHPMRYPFLPSLPTSLLACLLPCLLVCMLICFDTSFPASLLAYFLNHALT